MLIYNEVIMNMNLPQSKHRVFSGVL